MAKQIVNIGTTANDNTGDSLRVAGGKINDNFDELYAQTGWISYEDTTHTVGSPQVVNAGVTALLTNDGVTKINIQKPMGVTEFFDVATTKLTPKNEGDFITVDLMFLTKNTIASGVFKVYVDIPTIGIRFDQSYVCSKTANLELGVNMSFSHYVSAAFAANGGLIYITSIDGDTSIYNKQFRICRIHKAR
jgi:hypothetical protein